MLKFELKRLLAPRANQISLLVFFISALLAVFLGANAYKEVRKDQVIAKIVFEKERAHLKEKGDLPEMGSLAYYAKAPTQWQLSPWAALFTGQSQNNLAAMKVNALALQGQIYNKEVINPSKHRAGGFDLGFVLAVTVNKLANGYQQQGHSSAAWRNTTSNENVLENQAYLGTADTAH